MGNTINSEQSTVNNNLPFVPYCFSIINCLLSSPSLPLKIQNQNPRYNQKQNKDHLRPRP